jgi:hypothetical protein
VSATKDDVMQSLLDAMHRQATTPSSIGGSNAVAVKTFAEAYALLYGCKDD